jgi:hypothetical protein
VFTCQRKKRKLDLFYSLLYNLCPASIKKLGGRAVFLTGGLIMANIDLTLGGTTGISETAARKQYVFKNTIDFSISGNELVSTDIGRMLNIPAGFFMHTFGVRLDTVQGATATCVFGDGATADGWIDTSYDLDGTALDTSFTLVSDAYGALGGKLYHVADTIDIDPGHTVDTAIITVFAAGFMV